MADHASRARSLTVVLHIDAEDAAEHNHQYNAVRAVADAEMRAGGKRRPSAGRAELTCVKGLAGTEFTR
jgi:hypothetical protein